MTADFRIYPVSSSDPLSYSRRIYKLGDTGYHPLKESCNGEFLSEHSPRHDTPNDSLNL